MHCLCEYLRVAGSVWCIASVDILEWQVLFGALSLCGYLRVAGSVWCIASVDILEWQVLFGALPLWIS